MTGGRRGLPGVDLAVRHVPDGERRARLATRHALVPAARVTSPEAATRAMTVLHATEAATVHLSCWARVPGVERADVDRAFYRDRHLVKQLAMRRTLFVFPRDLLPAAWGSASARVAGFERTRMVTDVVLAGLATDGDAWLDRARAEVLSALAAVPRGLTAHEIRRAAPTADVTVRVTPSGPWSASRVLTHLGATADIVRADPTGDWRAPRPRWTRTDHWLDAPPPWEAAAGYRELVRRWLHTFGPGTEADLAWWLGATKAAVRAALADLSAVPVTLDGTDAPGYLLPDDLDPVPDPGPWVALLPILDPTVMGWRDRGFYLGRHREQLFDRNGNAGTTAWVDGRVVGCWTQDDTATVRPRLLEPVPPGARHALATDAARLTAWLGGQRVTSGLASPAMTGTPG